MAGGQAADASEPLFCEQAQLSLRDRGSSSKSELSGPLLFHLGSGVAFCISYFSCLEGICTHEVLDVIPTPGLGCEEVLFYSGVVNL